MSLDILSASKKTRLHETSYSWGSFVLLAGVTALLPFVLRSSYTHHLLVVTFLFLILTSSYNMIVGYTGYLTLAHATFFGLGAYVSAILTTRYQMHAEIGALSGILATSAVSFLLGWVAFRRVKGFAFSIVTLGFAVTVYVLASNWIDFTGGPTGILGVPRPVISILGHSIRIVRVIDFYYLGAILVAISFGIVHWIRSSRVGRCLVAIRENENLAAALGVDALKYKLFAFVVASVLAGIAGTYYAHYITVVTPEILWILWITSLLAMLIVGGPGSSTGVSVATLLLVFVPENLRIFQFYRELLYGILLLVSIRFMPQGIGGIINQVAYRRRLSKWRSSLSKEL